MSQIFFSESFPFYKFFSLAFVHSCAQEYNFWVWIFSLDFDRIMVDVCLSFKSSNLFLVVLQISSKLAD